MMDNEGGNMPILALAHGYIWAVAAVALVSGRTFIWTFDTKAKHESSRFSMSRVP